MIEKRISYKTKGGKVEKPNKPRPKPTYLNGNVIDLHPYLNDEWWEIETPPSNDDETKNRRGGLESLVASAQIPGTSIKDQFQTYYSILSRYFTPSDLRGKSLKDLDRMLQMFIKSNGVFF